METISKDQIDSKIKAIRAQETTDFAYSICPRKYKRKDRTVRRWWIRFANKHGYEIEEVAASEKLMLIDGYFKDKIIWRASIKEVDEETYTISIERFYAES